MIVKRYLDGVSLDEDDHGSAETIMGYPIMEDMEADQATDQVRDADTQDRHTMHGVIINMVDGYQHKIDDLGSETIDAIMNWLGRPHEFTACKIDIPSRDDLQQSLTIMRDKIVSIEMYSASMGGEDTP